MISEILAKYPQSIIPGRDSMLIAIFSTAPPGLIARGHHTFMVGFDIITMGYSSAVTTTIATPTGIKIFNRLPTIRSGCFYINTSILSIIAFLYMSSLGGITGLILANCIIDTLIHDTHSVVGHSHHVSSLGAVYSIYASFYRYINYSTLMFNINELIGTIHHILIFISSNIIPSSMHPLGIMGLPRRIFDYPTCYFRYNRFQSFGILGIIPGIYILLVVIELY